MLPTFASRRTYGGQVYEGLHTLFECGCLGRHPLDRLRKAVSNESVGISRSERFIQVRLKQELGVWRTRGKGMTMRTFAEKPKLTQHTPPTKSAIHGRGHFGHDHEVNSILRLQPTIGNQAALRMLDANMEDRKEHCTVTGIPRVGHDFSQIPIYPPVPGTVPQTGSGARDWHAQEANNITDNSAGKPGAPLADKGPWIEMSGNGGPGTKPDAGVPGGGGASAAPPKLSKKTVSGPTAGDCGGFNWVVQWELDKKTTKGGWVVQKVELPYDVKDCSDKAVDPTKVGGLQPSWYPLWEAWQINKDQQVTTYAEGGDVVDDTYASPGGSNTKGTVKVKGTAEFYDGLTLPSSLKVTNKPPTGILPASKSAPTLSGGTGAISHDLNATWDCCSKDKTATNKTKIETV
jgi:hypothetical protein